jgi:hypothetical protein
LPTSSEKEAFAKAFWIMPMTMRPGARKSANGTASPPRLTVRPERPSAVVKMTRKSMVVTAGAQIVCSWTLKKRRTSFT